MRIRAIGWVAAVAGAAAILALTGCDLTERRFPARDRGAATLVREHVRDDRGQRTVWSIVVDDDDLWRFQVASSRSERRGQERWRGQAHLRLCVAEPVDGVRIRSLTVQTTYGRRRILIDQQGC